MRVAGTIQVDGPTERELRVLSKRRRVEGPAPAASAGGLAGCQGLAEQDIAVEAGLDRRQAALWRQRFLDAGWMRFARTRRALIGPVTVTVAMESRIVHATLHDKPVNATHWRRASSKVFSRLCLLGSPLALSPPSLRLGCAGRIKPTPSSRRKGG